ncbi:MAG TPA: hypothetical protein DCS93_09380 [Microscillaceae bacterium]|nr:hypothetical protein [Microscillaceae bacterium]
MPNIFHSWHDFLPIFARDILPIYERHEQDFDFMGFHGRRHATRSVIFAELLGRAYTSLGVSEIDMEGLRLVVAFHDAAREANGEDEWERQSAEACKVYLLQQGKADTYATAIERAMLEKHAQAGNLLTQILHDADVLEFMRFLVNNKRGLKLFRRNELTLFSEEDLYFHRVMHMQAQRNVLIQEIWKFVFETEWMNVQLTNEQFLPTYLSLFTQNEAKYPLMNRFFSLK